MTSLPRRRASLEAVEALGPAQRAWVQRSLGPVDVVADMSWGLVDTVVLHARRGDQDVVIKAAGPQNHHIGREIRAHRQWTSPLVAAGLAPRLIACCPDQTILVTEFLPGRLVEGTPAEHDPQIHEQAGRVLRRLHEQPLGAAAAPDARAEVEATRRALAWLDGEHRIPAPAAASARCILEAASPRPMPLVPAHGDFQPRNWLVDGDRMRLIDFGRADLRPAFTDLCRLSVRHWVQDPALETAFFTGYGSDPRTEPEWSLALLREAAATAAWSHHVGDEAFENEGLRLLDEALTRF